LTERNPNLSWHHHLCCFFFDEFSEFAKEFWVTPALEAGGQHSCTSSFCEETMAGKTHGIHNAQMLHGAGIFTDKTGHFFGVKVGKYSSTMEHMGWKTPWIHIFTITVQISYGNELQTRWKGMEVKRVEHI